MADTVVARLLSVVRSPRDKTRRRSAPRPCRPTLELLERRELLSITLTGVPDWVEQGPRPAADFTVTYGPDGQTAGAVNSVAVSPADPNTVLVGTVNGGVWRGTNAGAGPAGVAWTPLTD